MLLALALVACSGAPPEPTGFDHRYEAFGEVLDGVVTADGRVRYAALRDREQALDGFVASLADVDVSGWSRPQQLAFWVNAYNAVTLALIVDHPSIGSIRELDDGEVWKRRTFRVAGQDVTLDAMEHQRARPLTDGRVHAVLNCASVGCPPLPGRPLTPTNLDAQLDAAARRWVATNALSSTGDGVALSKIFKWFPGDFVSYRTDAVPGANEAQARALHFIERFGGPDHTRGGVKLSWAEYDWALNAAE